MNMENEIIKILHMLGYNYYTRPGPGLAKTVPDFHLMSWVFLKAIFVWNLDLLSRIVLSFRKFLGKNQKNIKTNELVLFFFKL